MVQQASARAEMVTLKNMQKANATKNRAYKSKTICKPYIFEHNAFF